MTDRRFPILTSARIVGFPESVPWSFVEPHRKRAMKNHSQTLERLAERGGLGWAELLDVVTDKAWDFRTWRTREEAQRGEREAATKVMAILQAGQSDPVH
jgi:hypothetical protein